MLYVTVSDHATPQASSARTMGGPPLVFPEGVIIGYGRP
jgi:hypothetical protein